MDFGPKCFGTRPIANLEWTYWDTHLNELDWITNVLFFGKLIINMINMINY